eukprot:5222428-Amphidinium_carterae.1
MTDEEIAAVFRSMSFQEFVCGGLQQDNCQVVAVRVILTHIHFDILVLNGTFSTTTTEMPWGMPWWAWFLICCLSALLCCLCCLPLAGACTARAMQDNSSDNAKDPLRGTYQSLDNEEEGEEEEEDSVMSDAEGSIAAAEGV